jgi:prefoldin subunit 5
MTRILFLLAFCLSVFATDSQAQTSTSAATPVVPPQLVWVTLNIPPGGDESLEGTSAIARVVYDVIRARPEVRALVQEAPNSPFALMYGDAVTAREQEARFRRFLIELKQRYEFLRQPTVTRGALRIRGLHLDIGPDGQASGLYGPRPALVAPRPGASAAPARVVPVIAPTAPNLAAQVQELEQRITTLASTPGTPPAALAALRTEVAHQAARLHIIEQWPNLRPQLEEVARQLGELTVVVGSLDGRLTRVEQNLGSVTETVRTLTTIVDTFAKITTQVVYIGGGILALILLIVLLGAIRVRGVSKRQATLEESLGELKKRVTHLEGGSSAPKVDVDHLRRAA